VPLNTWRVTGFGCSGAPPVPASLRRLRRAFRCIHAALTATRGAESAPEGARSGGGGGTRIELFLEGAVSLDQRALERLLAA